MDMKLQTDYENETGALFTDGLTGLFNHGFIQATLDREIKRARRYGTSLTLALIDIDSFANFNILHGHLKGDRMLKDIAQMIKENIRDIDLAARYSGDVFCLILSESEPDQASTVLERIKQAVQKSADGKVTVSIGLSSYPGDAAEKESLINRAQEALLNAKISGKNKIYSFNKKHNSISNHTSKILIVDDEPKNLKLLEALLLPLQYEVFKATNGEDALSLIQLVDIDLILLDVMMPGMDGYEVCRRLKGSEKTRLVPVVMVTALDDMASKIKGIEIGADDFISKPPNKLELLTRIKSLCRVKALNSSLTSIESVLFSLANTVEAKDKYTKGHTWRVSELAVTLGQTIGLPEKAVKEIKIGGMIHDIGKIGVPKTIINKPDRLEPEEFEIMKTHPYIGYKICLPLKKSLGVVLDIIYYHHEKLDGSGYPLGLKGEEIPLGAKIMAVADIYDALTSDRPYRKAMSKEKALEILRQEAAEGKLDTQLVQNLIAMVE